MAFRWSFFSLTIFVALWTRKRISNFDSYLLAGRSLKLYLAMASLGATEIGLVSLMYTIIGGMVSVVITDYIQFIILFTGMLVTTYFALKSVGYGNIIQAVQQQYGDGGFNPFISKDLGWSFIIWMLIGSIFSAMWPPAIS